MFGTRFSVQLIVRDSSTLQTVQPITDTQTVQSSTATQTIQPITATQTIQPTAAQTVQPTSSQTVLLEEKKVSPIPATVVTPSAQPVAADPNERLLEQLSAMGFTNRDLNLVLLKKHSGNIDRVVHSIIENSY